MPASVIELHRAGSLRRVAAWIVDGLPFALAGLDLARGLGGGHLGAGAPALPPWRPSPPSPTRRSATGWPAPPSASGSSGSGWSGPTASGPGPGRSALRAAVAVVGTLLLGIGPLLALFTESGQGLHDLAARTLVVDLP